MKHLLAVVAFLGPAFWGHGIAEEALDATDRAYIRQALAALGMTPRDLGFKKDVAESDHVLPAVQHILYGPLSLPDFGRTILNALEVSPTPLTPPHAVVSPQSPAMTNVVELLYEAALQAQPFLPKPNKAAFEAWLVEFLSDKADRRRFAPELYRRDEALELQDDEVANALLAVPVDSAALRGAFLKLLRAVYKALRLLAVPESERGKKIPDLMKSETDFTRDTPLGKIICTSASGQTFSNEAFLIIATGHDNLFLNSAGGANGLQGRPISIVIATGHGNRYVATNLVAQGAGLFGIGILVDLGSNSTFSARHIAQGAGLYGCGALLAGTGEQRFEADTFCQGAGFFGMGVLRQGGGNTGYGAANKAQGFGGTAGYGILLDEGGDDCYVAGGKYPCAWTPGRCFSLAQGFGFGLRPFAGGGLGLLCDLGGNDYYKADVYGQGASYWYSLGLLLDCGGHDLYEAYQYCQGAGIHLSVAALLDLWGHDTYTAHAICQGAAHDYAVGMLIDRAGDDRYTGNSTAQGAALYNSFAMLLDRRGDDHYVGTNPKQSQAAGHDGARREYGSIALLLDLAGDDFYSQGQSNNSIWIKPFHGAGLDCEARHVFWSKSEPVPEPPVISKRPPCAPVDVHHPTEKLIRRAVSDRDDADAANRELKGRAAELLPYLLTRVDTPNVSLRSKIEELVDVVGTNAVPMLLEAIRTARNDEMARMCCYFLARFETATNAIPVVLPLLQREKTRATAFYTLGHLRAREALEPALAALDDPDELVRLRAVQALGRIGDARAIPRLRAVLRDPVWYVRFAAEEALTKLCK